MPTSILRPATRLAAAIFAAAALSAMAPASAATLSFVADGGTGSAGDGDIARISGASVIDCGACPVSWASAPTTLAASSWETLIGGDSAVFEFAFDLTGFEADTAVLSVQWSADNIGMVELNGTMLTGAGTNLDDDYASLASFVVGPASALFTSGMNSLKFYIEGDNSTDGIRAAALVEAEVSSVPLPAAAPLLVAGLGGLGLFARRRRAA